MTELNWRSWIFCDRLQLSVSKMFAILMVFTVFCFCTICGGGSSYSCNISSKVRQFYLFFSSNNSLNVRNSFGSTNPVLFKSAYINNCPSESYSLSSLGPNLHYFYVSNCINCHNNDQDKLNSYSINFSRCIVTVVSWPYYCTTPQPIF